MIYVKDDIPSKTLIKHNLPEDTEIAFIELNFWKCKWLLHIAHSPKVMITFPIILIKV